MKQKNTRMVGNTNRQYNAIVVQNEPEVVETGLEEIFTLINGIKKHEELEVIRILDSAEQWARLELCGNNCQLDKNVLSLNHEKEEARLAWFAFNLLDNVEGVREAIRVEDVNGTAYHSMTLMNHVLNMTLMGVEHEILIGAEVKKNWDDLKTYTDEEKVEWVEILEKEVCDSTSLTTPELVKAIMDAFEYGENANRSVSDFVRAWRKKEKY